MRARALVGCLDWHRKKFNNHNENKMKKVIWHIDTGYPVASHNGEFEIDDDANELEIEEYVLEEFWNHVSYSWEVIKTNMIDFKHAKYEDTN